MIPANDWWNVLAAYNQSIFPLQILFYALAVFITAYFLIKPGKMASNIASIFFSCTFLWIGTVFFFTLGKDLPAYQAQTFLFISLSVCFFANLFTKNTRFQLSKDPTRKTITIIAFIIVLAYPLVSLVIGRPLERYLLPGSFPCPTTALAIIFFSTSTPPKKRWLSAVTIGLMLLWAIPFPIMIQIPKFGVYEDGIMLASGFFLIASLIFRKHPQRKRKLAPQL